MNNLDMSLALFILQRQITDFHVLIQRLHFKPQQVQLQTGFNLAELFPTIKPMSLTSKTVLNSYDW
jgi:hypothetical protein